MKNSLIKAIVFIVFGVACFVVSMFPRDKVVESWSSFLFGFSFPLVIAGIVFIVQYAKRSKQAAESNH